VYRGGHLSVIHPAGADPHNKFVIIMKDGKIYKNIINQGDDYENWKTYNSWAGIAHLLNNLCHSSAGARL
jgi:hypothetical protein